MIPAAAIMAALSLLGQANPIASPAPQPVTVPFSVETWSAQGICLAPGVCLPNRKYPAGTLHIGTSLGTETARTYLTIAPDAIPADATIKAAVLHLPLDTTTVGGGSMSPRTAEVEVCTTKADVTAAPGSATPPPAADCTVNAVGKAANAKATEIDIDLAPIAKELAVPGTSLVLMPKSGTSLASWEVTLSSSSLTKPTTAPPSLDVTFTASADPSSTPTPIGDDTVPPDTSGGDIGPLGGYSGGVIADGSLPPVVAPSTVTSSPAPATPSTAPVAPVAAAQVLPHGFDYPAIFLLALVIGAGILALGRQLTRPLTASASTARHGRSR